MRTHTRLYLQPYLNMARQDATAHDSVLLDYVSDDTFRISINPDAFTGFNEVSTH